MSLDDLIMRNVRCTKCGTPGMWTCDCWEKCSCGWTAESGKPCGNPNTTRCSTKLKYGKNKRKAKKSEAA